MTPELNRIYEGDCLGVMRGWPDACVDLIVTDPPYGIGEAAGKNKSRGLLAVSKDYGNKSWDDERPSRKHFDEMRRVSKNQVIFGGNYFADMLLPKSCWIVWDKLNGATDFADCELAWTSFDSAVRRVAYQWQGMLQGDMKNKEQRVHPTQKPLPVMRWVLERYAKPGMVICDPFCGSGTTLVAAEGIGLSWVGIERDTDYVQLAQDRVGAERAQGKLF